MIKSTSTDKVEAWLASTQEADVEDQRPVERSLKRGGVVFSVPKLPSLDFGTLDIGDPVFDIVQKEVRLSAGIIFS